MDQAEFQRRYEEDAANMHAQYSAMSEDYLLSLVQSGKIDDTYQIWRMLSEKGSRKSLPILYNTMINLNIPYLTKYHACDALFRGAKINNPELQGMVQYGKDKNGRQVNQEQAILQLRKLL